MTRTFPTRIHLIAHAGPAQSSIRRFGFRDTGAYFDFIRAHLPAPYRLTAGKRFFEAEVDEFCGGRDDDAARVRDLQGAIEDPECLAIVAANGGSFFSRILPHVDFSPLDRRRTPMWALGFSEMTSLVNFFAARRGGRGIYGLNANYLAWKIRPAPAARAALGEFWRRLPELLGAEADGAVAAPGREDRAAACGGAKQELRTTEIFPRAIHGRLVAGDAEDGTIRLIGGCLSVLAPLLAGSEGRRLNPRGRWLAVEDINEAPYRVDRHLATLKMAGWFEKIAGVLVGDFHADAGSATPTRRPANTGSRPNTETRTGPRSKSETEVDAVLRLFKYHVPPHRRIPIVRTNAFGHVWPMTPLPLNTPLRLRVAGREVSIET